LHSAALCLRMFGESGDNETSSLKWYAFESRQLQRNVSFTQIFKI